MGIHAHGSSGDLANHNGVALVCAGLEFARLVPRTDPTALEGSHEFRAILDVLDQEDRRDDLRWVIET